MITKAIIPAKGYSERCPNKNIRDFNGSSLLKICIDKLKDLPIDEIIVSSDSEEILTLAEKNGATPQERPEEYANSDTQPNDLSRYLAEVNEADRIFYVHCTNPFIKKETMALPLQVRNWKDHDSINSAYKVKKHIWHDRNPLYDRDNRPNTQGINDIIALEYSFNLISREKMLEYSDFIGKNPAFILLDEREVFDIDTEFDWKIAENMVKLNR